MIRAGIRDDALGRNTPRIRVSCRHCVVRGLHDVHIADVMSTLKDVAIPASLYRDSWPPS